MGGTLARFRTAAGARVRGNEGAGYNVVPMELVSTPDLQDTDDGAVPATATWWRGHGGWSYTGMS